MMATARERQYVANAPYHLLRWMADHSSKWMLGTSTVEISPFVFSAGDVSFALGRQPNASIAATTVIQYEVQMSRFCYVVAMPQTQGHKPRAGALDSSQVHPAFSSADDNQLGIL